MVQRPVDAEHPVIAALIDSAKNLNDQKSPSEEIYARLLRVFGLSDDDAEVKTYSDCEYRNFRPQGLSFCFDRDPKNQNDENQMKLSSVHVYAAGNQAKFVPFRGWSRLPADQQHRLPYNLDDRATLMDIIWKFNPIEPEKGGGGRSGLNIWVKYPRYGLMLEFPTKSWDDGDCRWSEVTFFAPES